MLLRRKDLTPALPCPIENRDPFINSADTPLVCIHERVSIATKIAIAERLCPSLRTTESFDDLNETLFGCIAITEVSQGNSLRKL